MPTLVIRCPQCSKGLKLRDESKIGKKAKCPKCSHVFILQHPSAPEPDDDDDDEVELQLASAPAQQAAAGGEPLEGTAARWVPDNAPAGHPPQQPAFNPQVPATVPGAFPAAPGQPIVALGADDVGGVARLKEIKRRNARRRNVTIVASLLTASVIAGVVYAARQHADQAKLAEAEAARPKVDEELVQQKDDLRKNTELASASSPTEGEPIPLNCLPGGVRVLVSIRPAELWKEGSRGQEFLYGLGPLGDWATKKLTELCRFEPAMIEHAVIGLIPTGVGQEPDVAVVVRLVDDAKKSDLLQAFGGNRVEPADGGYPFYDADGFSYLIKDLRTIAICPSGLLATEMAQSVDSQYSQPDGIDALIPLTDQKRHLTIVFEPRTIETFQRGGAVFPDNIARLIDHGLAFFNPDEVETAAWALHLGDRNFHSELLLRNQTIIREHMLEGEMSRKLKQLPHDLWDMGEKMDPRIAGRRKIIGRFPAMTAMFAQSTRGGMGSRYAQLVTVLPERAAPNLAIGAFFTWDQAQITDFSKAVRQPTGTPSSDPGLPVLVLDRLKTKIDVEFARQPLQEAFKYIAEECKTGHDIDGDALKFKGYTKNMPQTFTMQDTGLAAIQKIVSAYDDMCLVIQEDQKRFLITTRPFAEQQKLTVYEFK